MNWYSSEKENRGFFNSNDDTKSKDRVIQMVKGLARSRNLDQRQEQELMNEAVSYISRGYDEQSVINLINQRLAV